MKKKIYTRQGDQGFTTLLGGKTVAKSDPIVDALGDLDECIAAIGLARAHLKDKNMQEDLIVIQKNLSALAAHPENKIDAQDLEQKIDAMQSKLEPLDRFIFPGTHPISAALHFARTVVRRLERKFVSLDLPNAYLNRLSDYLFVAARFVERHSSNF